MRTSRPELYGTTADEEAGAVQLCVVRIGTAEYAIDIRRVKEILPPQKLTPLPRAPRWEGVVELRGLVVPVLDLRKQLGAAPSAPTGKEKTLICLVGRRQVALIVDAVVQVVRTNRDALKPAPAVGAEPAVIGVFGTPPNLKLLLDIKELLAGTQR